MNKQLMLQSYIYPRANSIFWSRAQNIPLPHFYVFPKSSEGQEPVSDESAKKDTTVASKSGEDTVWVEGIVPGIDFCNHGVRPTATWEVDATGLTTGIPFSMYLLSVGEVPIHSGEEILISYGNKGNEELLYLYGFVMEDNPDDYLMGLFRALLSPSPNHSFLKHRKLN